MPNYTKDITPGKNLGFKVGPQSKIDSIIANSTGAVEGVFYLTYDTHKLYIGVASGSVTPVNEGVVTVASVADLPQVTANNKAALTGSFYYATKENILCVYNGSAWAQINTDTYLVESKFTTSDEDTEDLVKVNSLLKDSSGTHPVQDSFYVQGKNGIKVSAAAKSGETDKKVVEVEGDTYSISAKTTSATDSNDVAIHLESANTENDSDIKFTADKFSQEETPAVKFDKTDDNNIVVKVRDTVNKALEIKENDGGGFTITVTDSYSKPVYDTVDPTIKYGLNGQETAHFLSGQAVLDILSKSDFNEAMRVLNALTYRGTIGTDGSAGTDIEVVNGTTKILKSDGTEFPCHVGDMFLISTPDTPYGSRKLSVNTLLIARNKNTNPDESGENAEGIIPATELEFDVVVATIDTDTQYIFQGRTYSNEDSAVGANGAGINLYARTGAQGLDGVFEIGGVKSAGVEGDSTQVTGIEVSESTTNVGDHGGVKKSVVLKHGTTARKDETLTADGNYDHPDSDASGSSITIPVVVAVETNASGHVTKVKTRNYTIRDTNTVLTSVGLATSAYETNNGINEGGKSVGAFTNTVTVTTGYNKAISKSDSFVFSSETLQISADSTLGEKSGAAAQAGLSINMLWGSFE